MQELLDQIEMANEVKDTLCHDIALRTEELATAKLEYAQVRFQGEQSGVNRSGCEQDDWAGPRG